MSGIKSTDVNTTRRGFLKAASVVGMAGALGTSSMMTACSWLAPSDTSTAVEEKIIGTYHQCHCRGNCTIKARVRDGRLCQILPNDKAGEGFHKVCVKGLNEVQHVYSSQRLQTPLKRVGERGEGKFESITWDEAMEYFAEEIQKVWDKYGKTSVFFWAPTENSADVSELPKLLGATVSGVTGIDIGYSNGTSELYNITPVSGNGVSSSGVLDIRDYVNTKTHICIGSNFVESGLPHCSAYFDGLDAGMYSYIVDPNFTSTASKASEWVPIEPGTDPAFFLGLIAAIVEKGWVNEEFCKAHTTFPFLISTVDGKLQRDHTAVDGEEDDQNPYLCLTADGNLTNHLDSIDNISLEGSIVIDNVEYVTVYSQLLENAKTQTVAWAAQTTGISEEKFYEMADRIANHGPSRIDVGFGGGDRFQNSDIAGHAAGIVCSLTGNFSKYGSGLGLAYNGSYDQSSILGSWSLPSTMKSTKYKKTLFYLPYDKDSNIHALITWGDLQQHFGALEDVWEWTKTLDFFVYADIYNMTTAAYADLILPICTRFECEEEIGSIKTARWHLSLRQKCIEPLFESKSDFAASLAIAKALGLEDAMPKSAEERARYMLSKATNAKVAGYTIEDLQANDNVLPYKDFNKALKPKFSTYAYGGPANRLNVYYSTLVDYDQALPIWEAPCESVEQTPEYPLRFLSVKSRYRLHNQFCDSTWTQMYARTVLEMNPADLAERGLNNEDQVEVYNARGSFGCAVIGNECVRRGTVKILQGEWSKYMTFGNVQNVANSDITKRGYALPNGPVLLYNETLVQVKKA